MDAPKKYLVTLGQGGPTPISLSFDGHGAWKAVADDLVMSIGLESVEGDIVKVTVDAILEGARSGDDGASGDGKIFISELKEAIRIRTGEKGKDAIG